MFVVKRSEHNPILTPYREHHFEASAVFNMSVVKVGRKYVGVYRAMSFPDPLQNPKQISTIGRAESRDGVHFDKRELFIEPQESWEKFGCEDPRVTFFEGKYYIFYTALGGFPYGSDNVKTAVVISPDLKTITERHLVTPFNAKAMTLFPRRVGGKVAFILTVDPDTAKSRIAIGYADEVADLWSAEFWRKWYAEIDLHCVDLKRRDYDHIEIGATPLKIKEGWLLVYSYIQNYFASPEGNPVAFGVEVAILDENNPHTILSRTRGSILSPEEIYERRGAVAEIVFPSGAIIEKNILRIYYGGADDLVCLASVSLVDLVQTMQSKNVGNNLFVRAPDNPILSPIAENSWESKAVFNPAALRLGDKTYLFYRAMSSDNTSTIGLAVSSDNVSIEERLPQPIYTPREQFEMKKKDGANSGCEDPRVSVIGDKIYMCYTAYDSVHAPAVAVSSIATKDFLKRNFNWSKPILITPEGVDDKDACIIPEKIDGKYLVFHRVGTDICADYLPGLDFEKEKVNKCIVVRLATQRHVGQQQGRHLRSADKNIHGWLLLYHGVSKKHSTYRIGAALLDLDDPTIVLARSTAPIFEPTEDYEKIGIVSNVVFPCGSVVENGIVYIYYGAADKVIGLAKCPLDDILDPLVRGAKLK